MLAGLGTLVGRSLPIGHQVVAHAPVSPTHVSLAHALRWLAEPVMLLAGWPAPKPLLAIGQGQQGSLAVLGRRGKLHAPPRL